MPEDAGPLGHSHPIYVTSLQANTGTPSIVPMRLTAGGTQVEPDGTGYDLEWFDTVPSEWPLDPATTLYVWTGIFDLTRLHWRSEPSSENDGREYAIFALATSTQTQSLSGTASFYECVWSNANVPFSTILNERCLFGRTLPAPGMYGAPVKLWRQRRPQNPVPAIYAANAAAYQATFTAWSPSAAGGAPSTPFSRSIVSRSFDPATQMIGGGVLGDDVQFIVPLGHPSTGETKPHLYLFPTVAGVVQAGHPEQWSEALGYDCPLVLADQGLSQTTVPDPTNSAAQPPAANPAAIARHGRLAVERCIELQRCVGATPPATPRMCAGLVAAHVTPDPAWTPRNRLYIGAPGNAVPIRLAAYNERRNQYNTVAELSASSASEWLTYRVELRFGAGQVMSIDHLAHLLYTAAEVPSQGESSGGVVVNDGPLLTPGRAIGFVYRIEPWIFRSAANAYSVTINGTPVEVPSLPDYGNAFDWGVYDFLGTPNRFANTPRYEEANGAIGQIVPIVKHLFARCPFDFMPPGMSIDYGLRLGTTRTWHPEGGTPCQYEADPMYPGWARSLRDRAGALAGQWFWTDGTLSPPRSAPSVAIASEGPAPIMASNTFPMTTTAIDVSFRPSDFAASEPALQFTTCPIGTMPSGMADRACVTYAHLRPEFVVAPSPGAPRDPAANAACYEAVGGPAPSGRVHVRFRMIDANTMQAFRGYGACPTLPPPAGSTVPLPNSALIDFQYRLELEGYLENKPILYIR